VVELDWSDDGTALRLAQRDDDASATYRLAGDRVVGFEDDERTIDAELARNGSFSALTLHGDRVRGGRHDELPSIGCRDVWPSRRQRGSCRARRNSVRPSWEPINERGPGITPASASDDGDGAQHRIRATWCPAIRAAGNGPRGTNRRLERPLCFDTVCARIDLVTRPPLGRLRLIEVKNGPGARLSANQRAVYPAIRTGEAYFPYGLRAGGSRETVERARYVQQNWAR